MRRAPLCLALVVAACSSDVAPTTRNVAPNDQASFAKGGGQTVFNVQMRAEDEPNGASTSEAKGHAQIKVLSDGTMEFTFTVNNNKSGETFTRAHIHKAAAGANGPIHWDFLEAGIPVASIVDHPAQLRGVARPRAAAVLADLLANPDQYYVNIHSTAFPGGAIRGQLP